jgi:2-phosphosulfolactate phosphatase
MSRVWCEWGAWGVRTLGGRVGALVVVDVLSFCTAVDIAVARGASVIPCGYDDDDAAADLARREGAHLASRRRDTTSGFTLSPSSLRDLPSGARLVLPSPNGSALCAAAGATPVLAGCLRNAAAVAAAARAVAGAGDIGVVPAGERWPDGSLRPAIEDLLGAGAVIHHLNLPMSAEAQTARGAFLAAERRLPELIADSLSGRELIDRGFAADVEIACGLEHSPHAPRLTAGAFIDASGLRPPGPPR